MKLFSQIHSLPQPKNDRLAQKAQGHFFRDALATKVTNESLTPAQLQHAIFAFMPNWVNQLMSIRNKIVKIFGFSVGQENMTPKRVELEVGDNAGFMTVIEKQPDEIISYAEDKHMAFYLSVARIQQQVVVSTLVNKKTLIGRIYVNSILPFHYFIARTVINNAIKANRL